MGLLMTYNWIFSFLYIPHNWFYSFIFIYNQELPVLVLLSHRVLRGISMSMFPYKIAHYIWYYTIVNLLELFEKLWVGLGNMLNRLSDLCIWLSTDENNLVTLEQYHLSHTNSFLDWVWKLKVLLTCQRDCFNLFV